jgi:hypothetical protein
MNPGFVRYSIEWRHVDLSVAILLALFLFTQVQTDFKGFWRWCIAYRVTVFLDFFHRPVFLGVEIRRFGNWICFRPQVKGGRGEDTNAVGPLRVGVFSLPLPEDGNRFSFRNVVFLLPRTPDDGKSPKPQYICVQTQRSSTARTRVTIHIWD